ncbi:MAG: hypothetical protein FJ028_06035 [Chloroflexi bacterium]|nr:hypothetical protein [Chloroflexota bacterium]
MPVVILALLVLLVVALVAAMMLAVAAARRMSRPRPALPANCGDCVFMLPRAKVYKRETIEDPEDGLIHYLCQQRWIEVTPVSPWCDLGKSRTHTTAAAR